MTGQSSPLSIRKATPPDIPVIRDIAYKTWPSAYGNILSPEALGYMLQYFYSEEALQEQMQQGQEFFIAEVNTIPVGFGAVSSYEEGVYKLNKIYVLPGIQKTGAGKALMNEAIRIARKNGARELVLNVNRYNPAKDFYQKIGFTIIKEEDVDLGNGVVQEDYVMSLIL
jgi:ribosomal protein S18 acetylase RimI-like enzyme